MPGEIKGYWELHKKYGKLPWKEIFEPAIKLCEEGHLVGAYLGRTLEIRRSVIFDNPSLTEIFVNPATNDLWKEGDKIKRPVLGQTLRTIANEGESAFYTGSIAELLVSDIQGYGGFVTLEDLAKYQVKWEKPVQANLFDSYKLYSTPLPSSGSVLIFILNVLDKYINSDLSVLNYHRIVEAFKYAYGKRTNIGDLDFEESVRSVSKLVLNN